MAGEEITEQKRGLPPRNPDSEATKGLIYTALCFLLWGFFPIYWAPLNSSGMAASQILAHRIVWSAVAAVVFLFFTRGFKEFFALTKSVKILAWFGVAAFLLSLNWLTYLYAITNGHVIEASLGYFINPLFSIFLGRVIFKEVLRKVQAIAILVAFLGVLYLAILGHKIPWIAILLTLSFGFYGLVRKMAPAPALPGLVLETLWMAPFAAIYLVWCWIDGTYAFASYGPLVMWVLIGSGVVTTVPLILFAYGAKRISMTNLGIVQYISPTLQFIIGLLYFKESFDSTRFVGYVMVWAAVVIYIFGSVRWKMRLKRNYTRRE